MTNTARNNVFPLQPPGQPKLARGVALAPGADGWLVRVGAGSLTCRRATSCLLEPAPDDKLLLALDEDGENFILAVLDRPGQQPLSLQLDGDANIVTNGVLQIAATEGLELLSHNKARIVAKGVEVSAAAAQLAVSQVTAAGTKLQSHYDAIVSVSQQLSTVAERVIRRAKSRYQFVEEGEHVRAGQVDVRAEQVMSLSGQQTLINAQELVRIDGEQIHVG